MAGRTRERLHCETAISRDEASVNKQIKEGEGDQYALVYHEESSLWLWTLYFLPHCAALFSFSSPPTSEGPHWQSNLVLGSG